MEAALYAVGAPFVRSLVEKGSRAGRILERFKNDIDRPISAILILNTLAHTAGAAVAGAAAADLWGPKSLFWFSAVFTLLILFLSEIVPKVLGVTYNRPMAVLMAYPLTIVILAVYPLVFLAQSVSRRLRKGEEQPEAPEEEVNAMASISADEGSILPIEKDMISNVLNLNEVTAGDIMTPRPVVFRKASDTTLRDVGADTLGWSFSRVPLHQPEDEDELVGFVLRRDVFSAIAEGRLDGTLGDFQRPIRFVPKAMPGHVLLNEFIKARQHLFAVVDEWGGLAGVVSLEDILEHVIGKEIVDEFDTVVDMQEAARKIHEESMIPSAPAEGPDGTEEEADEGGPSSGAG